MKKYTELEDKIILDAIPEDGVFTEEVALKIKRQLPDRTLRSIKQHWWSKLKKEWLENKRKEAEAKAEKPKGFWQRIVDFIKPE
jgi:hypothetical protein